MLAPAVKRFLPAASRAYAFSAIRSFTTTGQAMIMLTTAIVIEKAGCSVKKANTVPMATS
jgi:hypothetical protein